MQALPSPEENRLGVETVRVGKFARRFGDVLRVGDGESAEAVIDEALTAGMSPPAVQTRVIAPAMERIGELWASGSISVADEHLASSISQRALVRLFEIMCVTRKVPAASRERVLLAAVEGQRHALGVQMVADVLEGAGFDVIFMGKDVSVTDLRHAVEQNRPAVVGLGFGISASVNLLADSLRAVYEVAPEARVMLGGQAVPLILRVAGYRTVESSMEAVSTVESLLAGPPQDFPEAAERIRSDSSSLPWVSDDTVMNDAVEQRLGDAADEAAEMARRYVRRANP